MGEVFVSGGRCGFFTRCGFAPGWWVGEIKERAGISDSRPRYCLLVFGIGYVSVRASYSTAPSQILF